MSELYNRMLYTWDLLQKVAHEVSTKVLMAENEVSKSVEMGRV